MKPAYIAAGITCFLGVLIFIEVPAHYPQNVLEPGASPVQGSSTATLFTPQSPSVLIPSSPGPTNAAATTGRAQPVGCESVSSNNKTLEHKKWEKAFSMRGGNDCSRLRLLDLTETPPYVNDFIIDMYARILRLTPRKGHAGVFPVPFRVLDLGSGCGYKLHSLTTRYHAHGLGIELSVSNVLFANVNYKKQGVLQYCAGNGLSSPGLRGQFDLVMEYGGGIKYSGTMGSHTDECIALRTGLTLMKPGGALFRGQVDAFDSMKPWMDGWI